jgi:NAD(P)-dependent dehydrogenase (short-subunit alcohol dehydrogenase family)
MAKSPHAPRLDGRTAVVTGGSRGIGLAIARRLVDEGAGVAITARHADALAEAADGFPAGSVLTVAGHADDPGHRAEVLDLVSTRYGALDILVNNAGINPAYGSLMELDLEAARKILDVNVLGSLAWAQDAYRHPDLHWADRRGSLVNVSSVAGSVPSPGIGMYGISKAAVAHLTRTLAVEIGGSIRVNAVSPAVVKTRFARALYEGREEEVAAGYPVGRLGEPEDVAAAVAFLVSDEASWINGQVLDLDGGLLLAGGHA